MYYLKVTWDRHLGMRNYYALWKIDPEIETCWLLSSTECPTGRKSTRAEKFDLINWLMGTEAKTKPKYNILTKRDVFLELL